MKKIMLFIFLLKFTFAMAQGFPIAKKTSRNFNKYNINFVDDYVWLERMDVEEVKKWVDSQNIFTDNHFKSVHKKFSSLNTLKIYDESTTYSIAAKNGKYFYAQYIINPKKPASLYYKKNIDDEPIEIVNPNKIYPSENVTIANYYPSQNSILLATKISINGSDRNEIRFSDILKTKPLEDVLRNVKFSKVAWNGDQGIFYMQNSNKNFYAKDSTFQLFYHKIGTLQEKDQLIFDTTKSKNYFTFFSSKTKIFVIESDHRNNIKKYYAADFTKEEIKLEKFFENNKFDFEFINYFNGKVFYASKKSNWGEVSYLDLEHNNQEKNIIPQFYYQLLEKTIFSNNYIICKYKSFNKNYISFYDYDGNFIKKIEIPTGTDIEAQNFDEETNTFYFGIHSYTLPYRNFKINIKTGKYEPFISNLTPPKPSLFPPDFFETKILNYKTRDNAMVTMTIVYKKGLVLNSENPTLLEAYGGFGVVSKPSFSTALVYFLEKGGVYAFAEVRGGGEKGEKWHNDGIGLKKMNTFNDFIDAAEFLISEKYTSPKKLAISGASQGGLLVGVAMTKRPDLFKVAVPIVGLFDMNVFQNYTTGNYWLTEYGNPNKENEFKNLMEFSPYQNIKNEVNYPTTLIITSNFDDRVVPLHSYKFAAKLQNRSAQKNPIFLKTYKKAGHNGNTSTYQKQFEQEADFYDFIMFHLNN